MAVETDASRYYGENARPPCLASPAALDQLLAHLAADLADLEPGTRQGSLVLPGALYDQTQVLRPGLPLFSALGAALPGTGASASLRHRALAARDGRLPHPELQPDPGLPPAALQLLPIALGGPGPRLQELGERLEHLLLERGQLSPGSARALENGFGIASLHARFMTLADLLAMLRLQLENIGFLPLWELLDAALRRQAAPLSVTARHGQRFTWRDGRVLAQFETFDHWAGAGAGRELPSEEGVLAAAYADWTREYRQYLVTLGAHHIELRQQLAGQPDRWLEGGFFSETSKAEPPAGAAQLTEHTAGDLGTVAVTLVRGGRLVNLYPLEAAGVDALHAHLRGGGEAIGEVAYPGQLRLDARARRLAPERVD